MWFVGARISPRSKRKRKLPTTHLPRRQQVFLQHLAAVGNTGRTDCGLVENVGGRRPQVCKPDDAEAKPHPQLVRVKRRA